MKKFLAILMLVLTWVYAIDWAPSLRQAEEKAEKDRIPLLIYFHSDDQASLEFNRIIGEGLLDFLEDSFLFINADLNTSSGPGTINKYDPGFTPGFVLVELDPERRSLLEPLAIDPMNLFGALHEIYTFVASEFIKQKKYDSAYASLKLIAGLPGKFGRDVKDRVEEIEPNVKNKTTVKEKNDNFRKAESYYKIALDNIKAENFEKATLYLKKIIEIAPGTDISSKASEELRKIKNSSNQ
ncbi:MAG: hypothetical protein R6V47_04070 [Candidatus Delongbacteria bacterium]